MVSSSTITSYRSESSCLHRRERACDCHMLEVLAVVFQACRSIKNAWTKLLSLRFRSAQADLVYWVPRLTNRVVGLRPPDVDRLGLLGAKGGLQQQSHLVYRPYPVGCLCLQYFYIVYIVFSTFDQLFLQGNPNSAVTDLSNRRSTSYIYIIYTT